MELKAGHVWRWCNCGEMRFQVVEADALRYDRGEVSLKCSHACWGKYLARNANKEKGKV